MLQPKTHFEQVPLEAVMRIVAEQLWQEEIDETALRDSLQSMARDAGGQSLEWLRDPPKKSSRDLE
jgi:hypothetical protein